MDWRIPLAGVIGLVLASLADWLFAGVLFHDRYQTYPEVWRFKGANPKALIAAQVLTLPTVVALIALIVWTRMTALPAALTVAVLVWACAAAPTLIVNGIYIKIDRRVVASHCVGWLVKLSLVAATTSLLLRR
jgi:glycerol-3-phosphate acyltransferase PlsY